MTSNTVFGKFIQFILILFFVIVLLVTNVSTVAARVIEPYSSLEYNLDYELTTQYLLTVNGNKTTNNDLYFISCVARTHLEHNKNISDLFFMYPERKINPTIQQIELVKSVINNTNNKCYNLYIVLPLSTLSKDDPFNLITVISNNLAFISYETFILLTVRPNL